MKTLFRYLVSFGFNPIKFFQGCKNIGFYIKDFIKLKKTSKKDFLQQN